LRSSEPARLRRFAASARRAPARFAASAGPAAARVGRVVFRIRDVLFPAVLLTVAFGTRPHIAGGDISLDHWMDAAGAFVALMGQACRVLVIGLVYITRGGQNRELWADALVDTGMFAHSRNPLYAANLFLFLGLAIVHSGWAMYLIMLPFFAVVYICIVAAEEVYLVGRFGDGYADYRRRVPRWVPSLRGLSTTLRHTEFDWRKVVRKEYGTPFAWISGLLILLVWEHVAGVDAPPIGRVEAGAIMATWIALATAYLIVRTLKLSGRLGTT
jgi:protein-S-isoprenylcysteine O-methyltransferase Ste14